MRRRAGGLVLVAAVATVTGWSAPAGAAPVSGPRETIDNQLTTTSPNTATGFHYTGHYHGAGDPNADPPYMRKMVSYEPSGMRFDTSVPDRCGASDLELALLGAGACPSGSRLGGGTADGKFMGSASKLDLDFLNNTGEEIIVVRSPFFASVSRGKINPDGSVEFASPTCFPALQPPGCPIDDALQLGSDITVAPYTRSVGGVMRSYLTTPPSCPSTRHWDLPVRFWWADGSIDTVVIQEPCTGRSAARPHRRTMRSHRRHRRG